MRWLLAGAAAVTCLLGCERQVEPQVMVGVDECALCRMVIGRETEAAGYELDGSFVVFDAPVCLLRAQEKLRQREGRTPGATYFADYETGHFHPADAAVFVLTRRVPTVMNSQVVCFGSEDAAARFATATDSVVDWRGYQLARGTPDRRASIAIASGRMEPATIGAVRGELVELRVQAPGANREVRLSIRGYEDAGEIAVPAETSVVFRFWATRPGAGFPVVELDSGKSIGMIKVAGPHTPDEEAL